MVHRRILYLEDDASTRTAMAYLFGQEAFDVFSYGSAEAAQGHLDQGDFDVAILDVRLPGRYGDDFGRELRERHPHVMVIFLTAEADIDQYKQQVTGSIAIRKPVDPAVLLELLKCVAGKETSGDPPESLPFRSQAG